jgi:predicted nucleic acid-binding protein
LRQVVCDTGPILHLLEADSLFLLEPLGHLSLPPAVHAEISVRRPDWQHGKPRWIEIIDLDARSAEIAADWLQAGLLDRGEAQALALATQVKADWFLTDDTAARMVASQQGIEVHGSLGVVLWAAATGHLGQGEAEASLEALSGSSLWLSARVVSEAKAALREIFTTPTGT